VNLYGIRFAYIEKGVCARRYYNKLEYIIHDRLRSWEKRPKNTFKKWEEIVTTRKLFLVAAICFMCALMLLGYVFLQTGS
jgi:hypothetical protein